MSVNKNLAVALRRVKRERNLSYRRFAEKLGIPISSLAEYMNGTGNPRVDTLELLASELDIPITEIVSGPLPGQEQAETITRAAQVLSGLEPEHRERAIQLFLELAALFSEENPT